MRSSRLERLPAEPRERVAEVRAAVVVDRRVPERVLDGALHGKRAERLGHLGDLRDEGEALHLGEALLQVPDELEHEARGVPHGVGHVAERDQARLLPAPPAPPELDRHPAVLEARAEGPLHVELALLLPPLPEGERVLDPPGEPGDDRLHLGDLVGRQREERLVGQEVPPEAVAPGRAPGAPAPARRAGGPAGGTPRAAAPCRCGAGRARPGPSPAPPRRCSRASRSASISCHGNWSQILRVK